MEAIKMLEEAKDINRDYGEEADILYPIFIKILFYLSFLRLTELQHKVPVF